MQVINNEHSVCCDVDDTLLMWDPTGSISKVKIKDPYTGDERIYGVHLGHKRLLRQYKARGYSITVWSKGGVEHAKSAVVALELQDIVDFVMAKPEKVVDDKNTLTDIVGPVIFLKN